MEVFLVPKLRLGNVLAPEAQASHSQRTGSPEAGASLVSRAPKQEIGNQTLE